MRNIKKIIFALVIIIGAGVFFYFYSKDESRLNGNENKWLTDNGGKVVSVEVINDSPIFGLNGEGVFYDYLNSVKDRHSISLNKISIKSNEQISSVGLGVANSLPKNSTSVYEDHYVLVSKNEDIFGDIRDISGYTIGSLTINQSYAIEYISDETNKYISYQDYNELFEALAKDEVNYIILPRMENISEILTNNYYINYHISDMRRYYYLASSVDNNTFYNILVKDLNAYKKDIDKDIAKYELSIFKKALGIKDSDMSDLLKSDLTYGIVKRLPYESYASGDFGGILALYIKKFSLFSSIDFEYKSFSRESNLIKDINSNKIDLYFDYSNNVTNGAAIKTNIKERIAIYMRSDKAMPMNSISSLKGKTIYVQDNSPIHGYLKTFEGVTIKTYEENKISEVTKLDDSIICIDANYAKFNESSILKKYTKVFEMPLSSEYQIRSLKSNDTLTKLLTKYFNYLDNNQLVYDGFTSANKIASESTVIGSIAQYSLYLVILFLLVTLFLWRGSKRVRLQKKIKKEDKLKYIDQMTLLKNRNYLTENIDIWNKNTIFPQALVLIDLNRIQHINDTKGYEEGDRQIKEAANILIRTQPDNSDIVRTNGNEFVVYLVGLNQKQITNYIHKLAKDFKKLPYEHGACISYTVIKDNLKTIEDAMNECVEDIQKQKEELKEND